MEDKKDIKKEENNKPRFNKSKFEALKKLKELSVNNLIIKNK